MIYIRMLEMFYTHNVIGVWDIYEIYVTVAKDILEWERGFDQNPFCIPGDINKVIATKAEEMCLWAAEVYTNANQSIMCHDELMSIQEYTQRAQGSFLLLRSWNVS